MLISVLELLSLPLTLLLAEVNPVPADGIFLVKLLPEMINEAPSGASQTLLLPPPPPPLSASGHPVKLNTITVDNKAILKKPSKGN